MTKIDFPKEDRQLWLDALRSGKYKQGDLILKSGCNEYCCLGVFCEVKRVNYHGLNNMPDEAVHNEHRYMIPDCLLEGYSEIIENYILNENFDLDTDISEENFSTVLAVLNDHKQWDFNQIADYIEQHTNPV